MFIIAKKATEKISKSEYMYKQLNFSKNAFLEILTINWCSQNHKKISVKSLLLSF